MRLWGIYSDVHPEVDLGGDRDSLRALAALISSGESGDVALIDPPTSWLDGHSGLRLIRLAPTDRPSDRIDFRRDDDVLVLAGGGTGLTRVVGAGIRDLADAPYRVEQGSAPTHLHLDPTSDPGKQYYEPSSISLVVNLDEED